MKSIYDAAVAYGHKHLGCCDIEDFEAGANYVLEQIEGVIQGDLNSHSTFKLKCIKQIVEELKSNQ